MNFYHFMNNDNKSRFGHSKWLISFFVIVFFLPILIYFFVTRDPFLALDEEGNPIRLGIYLVICVYWTGLYFVYKRFETKNRLNQLLDKLLHEEKSSNLFEIAKNKREVIRNGGAFLTEEGEERVRWFGIK